MKNLIAIVLLLTTSIFSQINIEELVGKSLATNYGYYMLKDVCDLSGGRVLGTPQNEKGFEILKSYLESNGFKPFYESFTSPIWIRGDDKVVLKVPFLKELRAYSLAYTSPAKLNDVDAIYVLSGYEEDYKNLDAKGKIVVINQERPAGRDELLRCESIKIAFNHGALACLYINEARGGKVLCGVGNFQGIPLEIPAFSLSFEEGSKLQRLLQKGEKVKLDIFSSSYVKTGVSKNLVLRLDGKKKEKIVFGAHFDSWDLGDGAADNGEGSAVIYETALLLNKLGFKPERTIEFVWFNGEETGLWGSRKYVEAHKDDSIFVMVNLDMPGKVDGFNIMGFDHLKPFINSISNKTGSYSLSNFMSVAWTNSDHMYFMFEGIPCITPTGGMQKSMTEHYHDFGDTFDKIDKDYISYGAIAMTFLADELSSSSEKLVRYSKAQMIDLLKKHNLESRLRKQEAYPY